MRTCVSIVLASLCLLGLGLVGNMVAEVAIARSEGRVIAENALGGQTSLAIGLIIVAVLWVISAWRLHVNTQSQSAEAARSARLRRLNDRLRLTNESLRASDKIKDDLLANTSHELRTPLTAILGFSEMLLGTSDPKARTLAVRIQRGGERLHHTVNGLLDMFKLQSGTLKLVPEDLDAASLVRGTVAMLRPLAAEKGLDLRVHPADLLLPAQMDRDALDRIVTNLIGNAIKFTEEGGVTVTVDGSTDLVSISVVDSGVGIAEKDLPTLFQPFTQATSGYARSHEGTGLGLAIVRQLVDLMGGQIQIDSRVGAGTMVQVDVPRWAVNHSARTNRHFAPMTPGLAGGQVLTVGLAGEDVLELRSQMEPSGDVVEVDSLSRALREIRQEAFDAIFMSCHGHADLARTRLIRRVPGYARTPLLRVGGEPLDPDALRRRGFSHQISSPLADAPLVELMEALLMDVEAVLGVPA